MFIIAAVTDVKRVEGDVEMLLSVKARFHRFLPKASPSLTGEGVRG